MPKIKVTQKGLEALTAKPHAKRVDYFDTATPGLCLTVGPRSATWYYFARIDGKLNRIKLGEWDATGIADARSAAGSVEAQIAEGKHPKAEQARERTVQREARALDRERIVVTVGELWSASHFPQLADRTRQDYRRLLADFVAEFGDRDVGTVRRGELIRYLDRIRARSATTANHAAVVLRLLFGFARDRFDLDASPAADLKTPSKPKKRTRTLDRSEIRVLWRACELAGYPYGHALRFALCTGQRIGEVGNLRRSDIDSTGDYWKQEDNKSGRRIDVYLAAHAKAVLEDCPNLGKRAPFFSASADDSGEPRPVRSDTWNNAIKRHIAPRVEYAAKELELDVPAKPWTPHDLRRTVRTALTGWCGVSPDTAERVLNHALSGLREVYDHADYRPHVADALQRWDTELGAILKGTKPQVIPLNRARKRRTG
jgi:integrase